MDLNKVKVYASYVTGWSLAKRMALKTEGKRMVNQPTDAWKQMMVLCEHSPLRMVQFEITMENVPQWVTVHFVRHNIGIEKFVHTQRPDRNDNIKVDRDDLPQGALNDMTIVVNAQALINISKVRLCCRASRETRAIWQLVKEAIADIDPIVASAMVPSCVYRGICPEKKSCGFCKTETFRIWRQRYEYDMTEPK